MLQQAWAVNKVAAVNGTRLPGHRGWPWAESGVIVTHHLVAQEVYDVGVAIGSSQVQRSTLVVVTGVGGHAIVDEQLHVGCVTIHTRLEEGPCSIHHAGSNLKSICWVTHCNGHCAATPDKTAAQVDVCSFVCVLTCSFTHPCN